ncbi:DUF2207 family protein [Actinotignum sp. GS-2025a]|uniref:DUF2207 family protein n=1 Tax=Actinotignum sp. GS-2025a TaxID=3427274 RepID=UPI003F48AB0D
MEPLLELVSMNALEFWLALGIGVTALVIMCLALIPSREYADLPRGVYPREPAGMTGHNYRRRRPHTRPPVRTIPPEMPAALGAFMHRHYAADDAAITTLLDLAARGFLTIDFFRDPALRGQMITISLTEADTSTLEPFEARFLAALASPESAESAAFRESEPFDDRSYRTAMENAGLPAASRPVLRVQGFSTRLALAIARDSKTEVVSRRGWYHHGRELVGSLAAVLFFGGIALTGLAFIGALAFQLSWYWLIVGGWLVFCGFVGLLNFSSLTPNGVVASDQVEGFRRFLTAAPRFAGVSAEVLASYVGWAYGLECADEWVRSLERINSRDMRDVGAALPWLHLAGEDITNWYQLREALSVLETRFRSHPLAHDLPHARRRHLRRFVRGLLPVSTRTHT